MRSGKQSSIERRVNEAAEAALAQQGFVCPLDILIGAGFVTAKQVEDWRFGRIPYLERVTTGSLGTISRAMAALQRWASDRHLKPSLTAYQGWGSARKITLRFSKSGNPNIERFYSTHYVAEQESKHRVVEPHGPH